jgi:HEPN domain-containing protein
LLTNSYLETTLIGTKRQFLFRLSDNKKVKIKEEYFKDIRNLVGENEMNIFQIKGRYPDYAENIEETVTEEICKEYLNKSKEMILCLQEKLR